MSLPINKWVVFYRYGENSALGQAIVEADRFVVENGCLIFSENYRMDAAGPLPSRTTRVFAPGVWLELIVAP